jgi:hypothetical protein
MTAAARRCKQCRNIEALTLVGHWELSELQGADPAPASKVADTLIEQSLGKEARPS